MERMKEAASEFLAKKRVAVTGVSRNTRGHGSNVVYQRLRQRSYQVFAFNPNADIVEGDPCYHDLQSIPGGVDWVMIGTRPETAEATMRECAELGITYVWMHRGPGAGSVSEAAAEYGRQHGIKVIAGGCPCMFDPTTDAGPLNCRPPFYGSRCHNPASGDPCTESQRRRAPVVYGVHLQKRPEIQLSTPHAKCDGCVMGKPSFEMAM